MKPPKSIYFQEMYVYRPIEEMLSKQNIYGMDITRTMMTNADREYKCMKSSTRTDVSFPC